MMRHCTRSSLISQRLLAAFFSAVVFVPFVAEGTPIYLRQESRFPSGHHPRKWLEARTKETQTQRWLRLETQDHAFGWSPEDQLLTPLSLALEATLTEATPLRHDTRLDALNGRETLAKGTRVLLAETVGPWVRVRLPGSIVESWIPVANLRPVQTPNAKAYIFQEAPVHAEANAQSKLQYRARASMFAQILREQKEWLEVRSPFGRGWIRRSDTVTQLDLGETGARPLTDLVPLRSAPLPYADVVRNLPRGSRLKVVQAQTLRWGQARVSQIGDVWWPMTEESDEDRDASENETITTAEIFKRKIFDMASSPAIPTMKFVSAQGIYRTTDGSDWTKIAMFQDKNYPIAIAGNGAIFVGPYVSDDHGETFEQWIRWDTLVGTLRKFSSRAAQRLQIQEIKPQDPAGRRLTLRLSVGQEAIVKLQTDDQGKSWRPF